MNAQGRALGRTRRVMTGSTGFVGSHFALRSWQANNPPITLTRASSDAAAEARVLDALGAAQRSLGQASLPELAAPFALPADLTQPGCGLTPEQLLRLRRAQPEQFWHFAASLRYEDKHRTEIFAHNLEGTARALELAHASGCHTFVYVSTAYTAGRRQGAIEERLHDLSAGFNNAYEESKARAEQAVADYCARAGLRFAILRPSIVIGPYATKSTGGSRTGLYGFLREVGRVGRALRALGRPVEFRGDGGTTCNLIPVDWFIDDILALLDEGLQNGGVYHNTLSRPPTIDQVGQVVARALDLPGFVIDPRSTLRSALEERFLRRTAFYGSYLWNDKSFQRQRPAARELSLTDLEDYVRGFLRETALATPDSAAANMSRVASRPA